MSMSGDVRVLRIGEGTGGIVHGAYHIARKGQRAVVPRGIGGETTIIVIPFGTIHRFGGHKMRISTLPATRDGGTVEVDHELMLGGALEDVEIVVHHTYAVGTEEVYLDTLDTHAAYPSKLAVAFLGVVEAVAWARTAAPRCG